MYRKLPWDTTGVQQSSYEILIIPQDCKEAAASESTQNETIEPSSDTSTDEQNQPETPVSGANVSLFSGSSALKSTENNAISDASEPSDEQNNKRKNNKLDGFFDKSRFSL